MLKPKSPPDLTAQPQVGDLFRTIADSIPQIVWTTDAQGRAEFFNRQWTAYTGEAFSPSTAHEVASSFVHPEDVTPTLEAWEQAQREERTFAVEHRIRSASGEYRWFLVRADPYRDPESGEIVRWFGTSTDVHDRKLAQGALRESEARYRTLFNSIDEGFCIIQMIFDEDERPVDYRWLETNPAWEKHTGLQGAVGRTAQELIPGLEEDWFEVLGKVAQTGEPIRFQQGSEVMGRWFDVFAFPVEDPESRKVGLLFTDISERRRAEIERERLLREAEAARARAEATERQLQTAFLQAPALVAVTEGPEHRFVLANPRFEKIVGRGNLVGRTVWEALPELEAQGVFALLDQVYATGEPYVANERRYLLPRDGEDAYEGWYNFVFQPLMDAEERVTGILQHAVEVTAQVRARMEIEAARAEAEQARVDAEAANRAKSEFLAVMSHELRTPLNAISGYAELLELGIHGPVTAAQRKALGRIQHSQRHLLGLVNEVLNYAKIETGSVHYDIGDVRVQEVLAGVEGLVEPQVRAKGLTLRLGECPPDLTVRADPEKMRQILLNLLSNAVKFTDSGGEVALTCQLSGDCVQVTVRDTGIGIPADKREAIFSPFVQVRSDLTRTAEGTGLGLAISRDLARAMGGDLTVESKEREGSTFTLRLPSTHQEHERPV